jgi:hypothetical protein
MAIPAGTKFHGVAPLVDTVNKGSAQANALRDAYTIDQVSDYVINEFETGIVKLVPDFIIASAGGSSTYSGTKGIVDFSWTGGSGDYNVTLPSAASIPYRFLRITTDGTVDANNRVNVYSPAPETIDGTTHYVINKSYNGIAVWSDGSNWTVIQAKAT